MITPFQVYWVMQLDSIYNGICFLTIICMIASFAAFIAFVNNIAPRRLVIMFVSALIISCVVQAFIPSTKTAAAMYVIPAVANNERVQQLPDKLVSLVEKMLDQRLKEGK